MNKAPEDIVELIKEHDQSLDMQAEIILLFPQGKDNKEELQIYVLSPNKVDFGLERQYLDARYKIELKSSQTISLYVYY